FQVAWPAHRARSPTSPATSAALWLGCRLLQRLRPQSLYPARPLTLRESIPSSASDGWPPGFESTCPWLLLLVGLLSIEECWGNKRLKDVPFSGKPIHPCRHHIRTAHVPQKY